MLEKTTPAGVPDKLSANRAVLIVTFREACGSGSSFEIDWMDERMPDDSEAHVALSQLSIKLLTGDEITEGDIDQARRAIKEMQGGGR